jgi:filamentous hemagglutinin family protein
MQSHRKHYLWLRHLIFGLCLFLVIPYTVSLAQEVPPITSSGLHTTVSAPLTLPSGQTQFDITGGTRPGGGGNLFHSFGDFNVPNNHIANLLNDSGLATSNILGRVTGGHVSNIFGTIQTTGFGNANLFLMNPTGFLFGPNATVNVGGMVTFTSADYLRLADNARFNAIPHAAPDLLLSAAPGAAFGFLGTNPGAITVQGSHLSVTDGTGISLVGGNITVQAGTLTAPSGQINLVSVGKPSHSKVGGEVANGGGFVPTGFKSLGNISLTQGSTIDTSSITVSSGDTAGVVLIRGGQFVMDASSIKSDGVRAAGVVDLPGLIGGRIEVTAKDVTLSNQSSISSSARSGATNVAGTITVNANTFSASDSTISASSCCGDSGGSHGGAVTVQGFNPGTSAHRVSLSTTRLFASADGIGGTITIHANNISVNDSGFQATANDATGGSIALKSKGSIVIHDSFFDTQAFLGSGGLIDFEAGKTINLSNTSILARSDAITGGTVSLSAPFISIRGSSLDVTSNGFGDGGTINLTGSKAVSLINTDLSTDNTNTFFLSPTTNFNGGTIHIEANKVGLTDTQVTTSVSGGSQTIGGSITMDAKNVTLKNSQILSTATEGHGGTIGITTHALHQDASSVIDVSSQSGTDGTVTITK